LQSYNQSTNRVGLGERTGGLGRGGLH
jgi:hypothetical protein